MWKGTVLASMLLTVVAFSASADSHEAQQEEPYLLQDDGEVRVLRGLETDQGFEAATQPPEAEEAPAEAAPAEAPEPQAEPEATVSALNSDALDSAEGRWLSEWQSAGGRTTTAKTTFDDYGRMASIPHRFATFYTADESGQWQGYWTAESGRHRCATKQEGSEHWGVIQLQFDEAYNHFEGTWDYCGEGDKWEWKGKRVAHW